MAKRRDEERGFTEEEIKDLQKQGILDKDGEVTDRARKAIKNALDEDDRRRGGK